MPDPAIDRAVQDAADACTVARLRTQRLLRRRDGLGDGYASVAAQAFDGQAALDLIARDPPDLIVTDVMMPLVDGVTLTRRLRGRGDSTPVVLMSPLYADVDIPGVRFLPKPFDLDHLVWVVGRVLNTPEP
jgi:DNA-binding response OmpR family regulator